MSDLEKLSDGQTVFHYWAKKSSLAFRRTSACCCLLLYRLDSVALLSFCHPAPVYVCHRSPCIIYFSDRFSTAPLHFLFSRHAYPGVLALLCEPRQQRYSVLVNHCRKRWMPLSNCLCTPGSLSGTVTMPQGIHTSGSICVCVCVCKGTSYFL